MRMFVHVLTWEFVVGMVKILVNSDCAFDFLLLESISFVFIYLHERQRVTIGRRCYCCEIPNTKYTNNSVRDGFLPSTATWTRLSGIYCTYGRTTPYQVDTGTGDAQHNNGPVMRKQDN